MQNSVTPRFPAEPSVTNSNIQVIKRDGSTAPQDPVKIQMAVLKAAQAVDHNNPDEISVSIAQKVADKIYQRAQDKGGKLKIHVESVQDMVELELMRAEEKELFLAYSTYRASRNKVRPRYGRDFNISTSTCSMPYIKALGRLLDSVNGDLPKVDVNGAVEQIKPAVYNGMPFAELADNLLLALRNNIEKHPEYSLACARVLKAKLEDEVAGELNTSSGIGAIGFAQYIVHGVENDFLDKRLAEKFDIPKLAGAINDSRDQDFTYLGLQTLYDRYLLKNHDGVRFELPQWLFMRVAMGLALAESDPTERALEFYNLLSSRQYMTSTPTLFNSGTPHPQLSSCYLTTVPDDLEGIFNAITEDAMLSKYAGGLGNDWTRVRGMGSLIKGTNGESQGVVPFLKVANDTAVAVNQSGKRKGAFCAYLETWHLDIEEFLELRKNTGDERRRTHDMNTANWIPDLFMQRVREDGDWTLFSPDETPDLHDLYGEAFAEKYAEYEEKARRGEIRNFKTIKAKELWRKMLGSLFETGHPWLTFKDPCNIAYNNNHVGVVHSSNLCTEITLHTNDNEIAVCNLGSIVLPAFLSGGAYSSLDDYRQAIDTEALRKAVHTAVRMLDNVIDYNFYALDKAGNSNKRHRPVGLGLMGFQEVLQRLGIPYETELAASLASVFQELISNYAFEASALLAKERGAYDTYEGSLRSRNILPQDVQAEILKTRQKELPDYGVLDWQPVRNLVAEHGLRNSNLLAIAPTATISNICGTTQSIEPTYQNLYVKSNLSGEFTIINPVLVEYLEQAGLWNDDMIRYLKEHDGSIADHPDIPERAKQVFKNAFEIDSNKLVNANAHRQKWTDQAISLNLYLAEPSGRKLEELYMNAWENGLKTTYYLRSLGATTTSNAENESTVEPPKACSILDPDCEACQ